MLKIIIKKIKVNTSTYYLNTDFVGIVEVLYVNWVLTVIKL